MKIVIVREDERRGWGGGGEKVLRQEENLNWAKRTISLVIRADVHGNDDHNDDHQDCDGDDNILLPLSPG